MDRRAVIIGAGLGGLATAVRLRHAGWDVEILEKNDRPGGRCNQIREAGFTFDTGPTLLLMPDVLVDLFSSVGCNLTRYLDLIPVNPNYRLHWGDGASLEFTTNLDRMDEQLEAIEPGSARAFRRYLADAGYKYRVSRDRFVERNFNHWYEFATLTNLYYLLRTHTLRKLDRHAARYFRDPRLIAAFTFQAMYLGLAPSQAPSVYALLPYTELAEGIWFPRGGLYSIVTAMVTLAAEMGVRLRLNTEVTEMLIDGRRVRGVITGDGETVLGDVVVANADLPYVYRSLLNASPWRLRHLNHGSSAYLLYLGLDRSYPQLGHHTVFLSRDVRDNYAAIFRRRTLPADPSLYICAANRTDPALAPPGGNALYVLVPVPALDGSIDWQREGDCFRETVLGRLECLGLPDLRRRIVFERRYTPQDFVSDYHITRGSAFGISHTFSQVGYMRPANKARAFDNLYFAGASTVPGGGVPMVILGSRLTTQRIMHDVRHG